MGFRGKIGGAMLLLAALYVATGGCNFVRITLNRSLSPEDVAFIVPGRTTFPDVIGKLGTPDSFSEPSTGSVAIYRFLDLKYSRVNFGWLVKPWSPIDPDLILSRTGFETDALQVFYDSQGVVTHYSFLRHLTPPKFTAYPF
jgi:hypothetical protein